MKRRIAKSEVSGQRSEVSQTGVQDSPRRQAHSPPAGKWSLVDSEEQAFLVAIARCMSQEFRGKDAQRALLSNFR